mgnify:CR=1 FL=1
MIKNGFTLIELLAVIVILAIIALIATPIILGIINDARKESQERSIELYASAVRNGIAAYQLREMKEVAAGSYTSETLPFDVEYDGDVECSTIELYEDGGVYVEGCTVNDLEVEYTYGTKQESVAKLSEVCTIASDSTVTGLNAGAKYNCTVDPNKPAYTFYVLNTPAQGATSVNLIMDSNITRTGIAIKEENPSDYGLVEWTSWSYLEEHASQEDLDNYENLNIYGPITAMEQLQEATKDWKNVNPQTVSTFTACPYGGGKCTDEEMAETFTVNARLPHLSEVGATECDITGDYISGTCPGWMVDYLYDAGYQTNVVNDVYGYWTLSSYASISYSAWGVDFDGYAYNIDVSDDGDFGVRPVVNLSI